MFDALVNTCGGTVYTVDISEEAIETTRGLVSNKVILAQTDSVYWLSQFGQPIDLLYLDSYDLDISDPWPSVKHHFFELTAASKNLHAGSIVCVDDTYAPKHQPPFGKGMMICEYMKIIEAERITDYEGYQVAWMLK